jgi:hypothetical protein
MLSLLRRVCPIALVLGVLALPSAAAPVPKSGPTVGLDKYLLDDTDAVFVINVKQIRASPGYAKGIKKQLEGALADPDAPLWLKGIGFDTLRDIDRVILCSGRSCYTDVFTTLDATTGYPLILLQGKFDGAKIKAKVAELAKKVPPKATISPTPGGQVYALGPRGTEPYVALVDPETLVIAFTKGQALDALAKGAGKKKTKFAVKEVPALLGKLRGDVAVQGFALEQTILSSSPVSRKKGKGQSFVRQDTLGKAGYKAAHVSITLKEVVAWRIALAVKEKGQVEKMHGELSRNLAEHRDEARQLAKRDKQFVPLMHFFDGVTLEKTGSTITFKGEAEANARWRLLLLDGVLSLFR